MKPDKVEKPVLTVLEGEIGVTNVVIIMSVCSFHVNFRVSDISKHVTFHIISIKK